MLVEYELLHAKARAGCTLPIFLSQYDLQQMCQADNDAQLDSCLKQKLPTAFLKC